MDEILNAQKIFLGVLFNLNKTLNGMQEDELKDVTAKLLNTNIKNLSSEMKKQYKVIKAYQRDQSPILNALKDNLVARKDNFKEKFKATNILRSLLGIQEGSGTLADAIVMGMERKRDIKDEKKAFREDYVKFTKQGAEDSKTLSKSEVNRNADILFDAIKKKESELAAANASVIRGLESSFGRARDVDLDRQAKLEYELAKLKSAGYGDSDFEKLNDDSYDAPKKPKQETPEQQFKKKKEDLTEYDIESQKSTEKQTELLNKIEENTREGKEKKIKGENPLLKLGKFGAIGGILGSLGGILAKVFGGLKTTIVTGLLKLFKPTVILRLLSRFFLPAMIVASLVNGVLAGWKEWKKTGSLKKAFISALGGIVEVLSFGFFNKEDVETAIDFWKPYVMAGYDMLIKPIVDMFDLLAKAGKMLFEPIRVTFETLKSWYDGIKTWAQEMFGWKEGDKVKTGWDFVGDGVSGKGWDVLERTKEVNNASPNVPEKVLQLKTEDANKTSTNNISQVSVNAPTTVNKSTTNVIPRSAVRNEEPTINKFMNKRAYFA